MFAGRSAEEPTPTLAEMLTFTGVEKAATAAENVRNEMAHGEALLANGQISAERPPFWNMVRGAEAAGQRGHMRVGPAPERK